MEKHLNTMEDFPKLRNDIRKVFAQMHNKGFIGSIRTANEKTQQVYQWALFIADNKYFLDETDDHFISMHNLINYADRQLAILYLQNLAENNYCTSTINTARNAINTWLEYSLILIKTGKSKVHSRKRKHINQIKHKYKPVQPNEINPGSLVKYMTRAYSLEQVYFLTQNVSEKNKLSINICLHCNLRVHELYSLRLLAEQPPSQIELNKQKTEAKALKFFCAKTQKRKEGMIYTVVGKGGLIREVLIPFWIHKQLEKRRLRKPKRIIDRGANIYLSYYDINGGNRLSACFTRASQNNLGWSTGIHSLRHDYAKARLKELFKHFKDFELARLIVSQELGHFRSQITNTYLY